MRYVIANWSDFDESFDERWTDRYDSLEEACDVATSERWECLIGVLKESTYDEHEGFVGSLDEVEALFFMGHQLTWKQED